jgi:hypothetical protein
MHEKKHLSFSSLVKNLSERMAQIPDTRQAGKVDYSIHDCCMSAFAMMFFQDPSMLEFQTRLQDTHNLNNLKTLFHVQSIPKDSQFRAIIDDVPSYLIEETFLDFYRPLQRGKHLEQFRFLDGRYLVSLDGTQQFSSDAISCPHCLQKKLKSGKIIYHHQVLAAAIVHPDNRQVIPLAPEPIHQIDGQSKQDCEINAGKRMVGKIREDHSKLNFVILGDSLYSKQPFIDVLLKNNMSFILGAKPDDHKVLFEWVSELKAMNETQRLEIRDFEGRQHIYEWVNDVPLNGRQDARNVNFFEYTLINEKNKQVFFGTWVTDIAISEHNITELVKAGRCRWKIENENFNTLKNQGYHAEHNFGHGKKNAGYNFFLFTLLAFFVHQILELTDPLFQACRQKFSSRKEFWNQLRCTVRIVVFRSWRHLLEKEKRRDLRLLRFL